MFIFIVFSFCYIVDKGNVKAIFWLSIFNTLWSSTVEFLSLPPEGFYFREL